MFSGIVADVGTITRAENRDGGLRLAVETHKLGMDDVQIGDSIAVNGVCLTVVKKGADVFTVDVSSETLNCTVGLEHQGARVNLEKALHLADRLGGHLVSGHVDGVGEVVAFNDLGESWKLSVRSPQTLAKYIAAKGSITINGVSLTQTANVTIGGKAATFKVINDSEVSAIVPGGAKNGQKICITTAGGTVCSAGTFTVEPKIISFSPTSGPVGTLVTIKGTTFTGTTKVTFGGGVATSFQVINDSEVQALVPGTAKTGKIQATTPGGTATSATNFTVT